MENPYEVLGIPHGASIDDVKTAYKKLAKKYHPDVNKDPDAENQFKKINEAYEQITNPKQNNPDFGFPGNPFDNSPFDFFNFDFFGRNNRAVNTPITLKVNLNIDEVYSDCVKNLSFKRTVCCDLCFGKCGFGNVSACKTCLGTGQLKRTLQQGFMYIEQNLGPCNTCSGKGKIFENICNKCQGKGLMDKIENINLNIPKGSLFKAQVFENMGNQNDLSQSPGHLVIEIGLENSNSYNFDNEYNLLITKQIDPVAAILGDEILVDIPNKEKLCINLDKNTPNNHMVSFANKGLPKSQNEYGTLLVKFMYNIPDNISEEETKILQSYLNLRKTRGLL